MIEKYLKLLNLNETNLSHSLIDKKFKEEAKNYHPDLNSETSAHDKMKKLIEARDKLKKYLSYSKVARVYNSNEEIYRELKNELFRIIEKYFKILDGYSLCKEIWPILEEYDHHLSERPNLAIQGGFAKLFRRCGFVKRVYDEKKDKWKYIRSECSLSSGMKLLETLKENKLIDYTQKGTGRGSRLRITINKDNIAKFIIENSHLVAIKVLFLENSSQVGA